MSTVRNVSNFACIIRKKREWHAGMLFVQTIIPWMSEWLYFYEIWLCCGKWLGGGIEHSGAEPK